jgi:DNA polymerase elongation subunit (family B)
MRILTIDIETRPHATWTWGLFGQYISIGQIEEPGHVICFAAKWLDSPKVIFYSDFHDSHEVMVQAAWDLINEADAVITYNGRSFDVPHLNREFILAGLTPPSPHKDIDLYLVARKAFKFASNKLDWVAQCLGLGGKVQHAGFQLWIDCMNDDPKAWRQMKKYNIGDILLTEKLYFKLLPWIPSHPAVGLYDADGAAVSCPNCGSDKLEKRGFAYTTVSTFQRFVCKKCGKWSRATKRLDSVETRNIV